MRLVLLTAALLAGCDTTTEPDTTNDDTLVDAPTIVLGACVYSNSISGGEECKEYRGAGWTVDAATGDCDSPSFPFDPGTFTENATCDYPSALGICTLAGGTDDELALFFPGDNPDDCGGAELGCGFAGGTFEASAVCEGGEPVIVAPAVPFTPFEEVCVDDARAEDGEVCVWNAISGAVEPGFKFAEFGDCDAVRTQRPYVPYAAQWETAEDDPRLTDVAWQAEFDWFTSQVESTACICCHSDEAPNGASGWFLEAEPIWLDSAGDEAVAMFAGWIDSTSFGAFPADELYGFDRTELGMPTTDIPRMRAFLEAEMARRGYSRADFADEPVWGGPLATQLVYEPEPCNERQGIDADGKIIWTGSDARYVYVMEEGTTSPTVPPNLDLPDGTLWRIDVGPDQDPIESGVTYGEIPGDARQAFPETGAPAPLESGETYYLVALADIIVPATRCTFVAP
jgi:hypothetical protein